MAAVVRRPVAAAAPTAAPQRVAAPAVAPARRPVAPQAAAPATTAPVRRAPATAPAVAPARTAPTTRAAAPQQAPAVASPQMLAKRLAAMRTRWDNSKQESAKDDRGTNANVGNGEYATRLTAADIRDVEGVPGVIGFKFVIAEGDLTGEELNYPRFFDTDDKLIWTQRDLRRLGVDVDNMDITDLPAHCAALTQEQPGVRISVKWNGEYQNVRILKLIEIGGEEIVGDAAEQPVGEEVAGEVVEGELAPEGEIVEGEVPVEGEIMQVELNIGDEVSYINAKNQPQTGILMQLYTDGSCDIRDGATKKMVEGVSVTDAQVQPLAAVAQ